MSGDLTARDAIARGVLPGIVVDGKLVPDHEGADRLLAALAAAGWRPIHDDQLEYALRHLPADDAIRVMAEMRAMTEVAPDA